MARVEFDLRGIGVLCGAWQSRLHRPRARIANDTARGGTLHLPTGVQGAVMKPWTLSQ